MIEEAIMNPVTCVSNSCIRCEMPKDKPMKNMEESNTIESESDDQDRNAETISSGILNDMSEPEDNRKPLTDYSLITGEQEGYNVILEVNGYQYFFNMAMQPEKIELQSPKEREEERDRACYITGYTVYYTGWKSCKYICNMGTFSRTFCKRKKYFLLFY